MLGKNRLSASIVIPALQEEKYIGNLLSKIVSINPNLEIIVVDGGSTDNTVNIARKFTEKVYVLKERGIGKARNYGAHRASGDIIFFMDADVEPPQDFLEKTLSAFKRSDTVGVTCNIMPKDPSLCELAFFKFYNLLLYIVSFLKPHSQGKFFAVKREAFLKIGGFNENLPCVEDHEMAFRLSKVGRVVFLRNLTVYESMRRFRKEGFLKVLKSWIINYISLILYDRTVSKSWEPVR
ncbi:MAG: glycosyltransferase [Candidatus Bathyarchaeia archaeon]